jgi:hypothetical protein
MEIHIIKIIKICPELSYINIESNLITEIKNNKNYNYFLLFYFVIYENKQKIKKLIYNIKTYL